MQIEIQKPAHRTIYPNIGDNLEAPEDERFAIELERPSDIRLSESSVKFVAGEDGEMEQQVNTFALIRAYIRRLVNPIDLKIDGKVRKMTVADLFKYNEFADTMQEIDRAIGEMREEAADRKN